MKARILVSAAALLLAFSCTKENSSDVQSYTFSLAGTLEELDVMQETKVTLAHTMKMSWTKGDKVSVVNLTKGKALGGSLTADQDATKSTFSGTVTGHIDDGDVLFLIYPDLGYISEQDFINAKVDFSSQDGTDKNAKFCAISRIEPVLDGNFIYGDTYFTMKSGMINITLADLPANTTIDEVHIENLYSEISLSINSAKSDIVITGTEGTISMYPNSKTSVHGTKGLYFGLGGARSVSARRKVSVICGDDIYESDMTNGAIGSKFYTLSIGAFSKKNVTGGFNIVYDDTDMEEGETINLGE